MVNKRHAHGHVIEHKAETHAMIEAIGACPGSSAAGWPWPTVPFASRAAGSYAHGSRRNRLSAASASAEINKNRKTR